MLQLIHTMEKDLRIKVNIISIIINWKEGAYDKDEFKILIMHTCRWVAQEDIIYLWESTEALVACFIKKYTIQNLTEHILN